MCAFRAELDCCLMAEYDGEGTVKAFPSGKVCEAGKEMFLREIEP